MTARTTSSARPLGEARDKQRWGAPSASEATSGELFTRLRRVSTRLRYRTEHGNGLHLWRAELAQNSLSWREPSAKSPRLGGRPSLDNSSMRLNA